ncbi:unnamed protein product [Darwinula stevensoni]|uniref:Ig-like domain-containing protein n=1 Tax=Darwinula stevensoni TaxID=69355 RepID=A0A7R9A5T9_9CRUS|nr:unnamed protein product [Darwinula stevensoni]CAG0895104.1 unnamed protein product [Darwinula stevensoni]
MGNIDAWISIFVYFLIVGGETTPPRETPYACPQECTCLFGESLQVTCSLKHLSSIPPTTSHLTLKDDTHGTLSAKALSLRNLTSLRHLSLKGIGLTGLHGRIFQGLRLLQELDLSENLLREIPRDIFYDLRNLRSLNLSHNALNSIGSDCFNRLISLQVLDLSHNQIQTVDHNAFLQSQELRSLYLDHNSMVAIDTGTLDGLSALQHLKFHHNPLVFLPNDFCLYLKNLKVLDLTATRLFFLEKEPFLGCENISTFIARRLPNLRSIRSQTFSGMSHVRTIIVSENPALTHIADDAFEGLQDLDILDLTKNQLSNLPYSLSKLSPMKVLALERNPFTCSCELYWLKSWMKANMTLGILCGGEGEEKTLQETLKNMTCTSANITETRVTSPTRLGADALLECNTTGNPLPVKTWVTPNSIVFHYYPPDSRFSPIFSKHPRGHHQNLTKLSTREVNRFHLLPDGSLYIEKISRLDIGEYLCFVANTFSNASSTITLVASTENLLDIEIESILFGVAVAALILLITLIYQLIKFILTKFGCCCYDANSPRARQIRQILENLEQYRTDQLDWIRQNYNMQAQKVKENCAQQIYRIRESYAGQVKTLRGFRDYGTNQLSSMRDQYYDQVKRVKEYSMQQMQRARENYIGQRERLRKFTVQQLIRLRENYKLQQKTLNKIMENIPSINMDNCRMGSCNQTDSMMLDELDDFPLDFEADLGEVLEAPDITPVSSVYFTPEVSSLNSYAESDIKGERSEVLTVKITDDSSDEDCHESSAMIV